MQSSSNAGYEDKLGTIKGVLSPQGTPNTLSVCMIVKNEEENISRAIRSFLPFADEIVVNDTGSTDNTLNILRQLPKVKIIESEWKDDFSYSRNLSIDAASCSWILWMDADDFVPPEMVDDFKKLKTAPLDRAFGFQVVNTQNGQPIGLRFIQTRMFPNHPSLRFERKVHEQIIPACAELGLHMFYLETQLWHLGYEDDEQRKQKALRNLEILREEPGLEQDPSLLMQMGDSFAIIEDEEQAAIWYKKAWELPNLKKIHADIYKTAPINVGRCYQRLKNFDEAVRWLEIADEVWPENLDAKFYKAESLWQKAALQEESLVREELRRRADEGFLWLLEAPIAHTSLGTQFDVIKLYSFKYHSEYALEQKQFAQVLDLADKYKQKYPDIVDSYFIAGKALLGLQQPERAITELEGGLERLPGHDKTAWYALIHAYELLGDPVKMQNAQHRMKQAFPEVQSQTVAPQVPSQQEDCLLSVCMIVKNEEESLPACLQSIQGLWDELIIVDTGSTDSTPEIIKKSGAQYREFAWVNDFAAARNQSIRDARGKYILWLDADDVMLEQDKSRIRAIVENAIQSKVYKAHSFMIKNSSDGGNTGAVFNQIRLFPNGMGVEFEGRIHEQLLPSLNANKVEVEFHNVKIIHTGYADVELVRQKHERNLNIMLEDYHKGPAGVTSVRLWSIASSYHDLGRYEEALEWYQKALDHAERKSQDPHVKESAPLKIATCYAELGRYDEAMNGTEQVLQRNPQQIDGILLKAQLLEKIGREDDACREFGKVFWFEEVQTLIPVDYQGIKIKAIEFLGRYWDKRGLRDLAVACLKLGVGLSQGQEISPLKLVSLYFEFELYPECVNLLRWGMEFQESEELFLDLGKCFIMLNQVQDALHILNRGLQMYPSSQPLSELFHMLQKDLSR